MLVMPCHGCRVAETLFALVKKLQSWHVPAWWDVGKLQTEGENTFSNVVFHQNNKILNVNTANVTV